MSHRGPLSRLLASLLASFLIQSSAIIAQPAAKKPVTDDSDFAQAVKQWTTKPEFISPLVDHLPRVTGIPEPKDILGHHIGEPKKLTYYSDILKYYGALAAA